MVGQGLVPERYDPLVDTVDDRQIRDMVGRMGDAFQRAARAMPTHADYIARHCAGSPM
jgi:tryptophan 7-halogenase